MKKRLLSLFLVLITALGMFSTTALAAGSEQEALGEIKIFNGGFPMKYLSINGRVREQIYTYYNFVNTDGSIREIPAYCVNPNDPGVPQTVAEGESIEYLADEKASDPKVTGIVANGYPNKTLGELGLENKYQAYYATKMALWCYLLGHWDINDLKVNPNLTGVELERAQNILAAANLIYRRGTMWTENVEPNVTCTADRDVAYEVTVGGRKYKQQVFTFWSQTWVCDYTVNVSFTDPDSVPAGTRIVDMNNNDITTLKTEGTGDGYAAQFKVLYPLDVVEGQTGSDQLSFTTNVYQYAIFYASCVEVDKYGNLQNYMVDTDPTTTMRLSTYTNYIDDEEDEPDETALRIIKYEAGTTKPLAGARFEVIDPDGATVGVFSTDHNGEIKIPLTIVGNYTVIERSAPSGFLIAEEPAQNVTVVYEEVAEVVFENEPYGNLRVEKTSDTGENLPGAIITIEHIESGKTYTAETNYAGVAIFNKIQPGGYRIQEESAPLGWKLNETVYTTNVLPGETTSFHLVNEELPGLRIIKYDRKNMAAVPNVTFEVFRDGVSLGDFQTDEFGEILLVNVQPGTYWAVEVDTGNEGLILDITPQEIELKAGDGIRELVFFNDTKPGMRLVKVDSNDPSRVIPNAVFEIKSVAGDYGPEEYRTDENGEIDLSHLPTGAYVVTEKECAGYVIDDAQRIIQLDANETAEFVFTNSKLPSLRLIKTSTDGTPLGDVTYRLAKIEDGTRYLDRTTDSTGTIVWEGLEPGVYSLVELSTREDHVRDTKEYHIELFPGKTSEICLTNSRRPNLTVWKHDADSGQPVPDTVFLVRAADGHSVNEIKTGPDGSATLENLLPGVYEISEKSVPEPYLPDAEPQLVTLYPDRDRAVYFENHKKPTVTIRKENKITHDPVESVMFQVWWASNKTTTGELRDLGTFYTDKNGEIVLKNIEDGWLKIQELEAPGYAAPEEDTQEIYIAGGESKTVLFQNVPESALIVWKRDSVSGAALSNCRFQLRYLGGDTSGSGGTVVGTYVTSNNGSFTVTGLKAGYYICEELESDGEHVIDSSPQYFYISGKDQDVVQLYFSNAPLGSLLVSKKSSADDTPLSDVEFLVTTSDGTVVGNSNGSYVTDSTGSFLVENIIPSTTLVVKEIRGRENFVMDDTPQTATIRSGQTVTLEFLNDPYGSLLIRKVGVNNTPLSDVEFLVTTSDGTVVGNNGGKFVTDSSGTILIENLPPKTNLVIKETRTRPDYILDSVAQTVVIESGKTSVAEFRNSIKGNLRVLKLSSVDQSPLEGVEFEIRYADGSFVDDANGTLSSAGRYFTDKNGEILIENIVGTVVVTEVASIPGYSIDEATRTQTVTINSNDTQTLRFYNTPDQSLTVWKFIEGTDNEPLAGVRFLVTTSSGEVVGPNNGYYTTDDSGRFVITGLKPGITVTAREVKTVDGFVLDGTPQSILIKEGEAQSMTFFNRQVGGVEIVKVNEADKTQRIPNTTFEIRKVDDELIDTVTTDRNGRVFCSLEDGAYYAVEVEAAEGFKLDNTPIYFEVEDGKTVKLQVTNRAFSGILIHKTDSTTGQGIYGVSFLLYDAGKNPIGQYTSDDRGYVYIDDLPSAGRYYLRELENEGYVPDTQLKTVYVTAGTTTEVEWENTPITGQIQILKTSADYNSMNGWPAGTPIPNTVFEVYHYRTGKLVDTIQTDKNGVAVTKPLPLGRYKLVESRAADFYGLDKTPIEVEIEFAGQIVKAAMTNKSLYTNVSIKKTSYVEVMPGQSIRYDFSEIANNSTTALTSFYWRDTLPTNAVRLDKIVTGTYNTPGNYKIVYLTNLSGGSYRTLADNLSTMQNYVLDASPAALGLAANEYVTEFMVSFGVVPPNFRQVEAPRVYCNVVSWLTGGTQFVNQADVGGVYNGQWIMANTRWVTTVYKPSQPLPRTGY